MLFDEWIEQAYALGASDLHLEAETPVLVRVRGDLQAVGGTVGGGTLLQVGRELVGRGALGAVPGARLRRPLRNDRRNSLPHQFLSNGSRHGGCNQTSVARHQGSSSLQSARRYPQVHRGVHRLDHHFRADRIGKIDDARRAHRRDQLDPSPQHHLAGKPRRIPVRQPAIVHPPTRGSNPLAELRTGHHRRLAREPGCSGHQRDANAGGHAAHPRMPRRPDIWYSPRCIRRPAQKH